jgi:hypothetical protein
MPKVSIDIAQGSFRIYEHGGRLMLNVWDGDIEINIRLIPASALVLAGMLIERASFIGKAVRPLSQAVVDQCVRVMSGSFGHMTKQLVKPSEEAGFRRVDE